MKMLLITAGMLCLMIPVARGNFLKNYLTDPFPIIMVDTLPDGTSSNIIMISTRQFKPDQNFLIQRGLDPHYKLYYFIVGQKGDTAFVQPLKELSEVVNYIPDRSFLVHVDGHGKTFAQAMERGFEMTNRFNVNLVVFDWPSDYLALRKTVYNADEVAAPFVKAMRAFDSLHSLYYSSSLVSVMFHSMGNRILKDVSSTRLLEKMPDQLFSNIIINAAAVKQQNHAKWVEKLNIQKRIYITSNVKDFNLRGAAVLRMAEQLGLHNRKFAQNAFYVNFSDYATVEHNLFLGKSALEQSKPEIFRFYDLAFKGKEVTLSENSDLQIFSPSDNIFLFSVK